MRKLIDYADAILITNETNVRYLTGFTGDSSYLIVARGGDDLIISDPRYEIQLEEQCPGIPTRLRKTSESLMPFAGKQLDRMGFSTLAIEGNSMTMAMYEQLRSNTRIEAIQTGRSEVEQLRTIKDADEILAIKQAVEIAQRAFASVRAQLTPSMTELEIAYELERLIRVMGGQGCSFRPIVACGPNAALPHAAPGKRLISENPLLLIDWGATVDGYRSDLTRVLMTSKIPAKFAKAYEAVLAAQTTAIDAMRPGVKVGEIDELAREVIASAKLGKRFNHGLGHGIGLDIHEAPRLGAGGEQLLVEGMVVTVEPGVYFPGQGGIRIEDDVLITRDGCQVLSSLPKTLAESRFEFVI